MNSTNYLQCPVCESKKSVYFFTSSNTHGAKTYNNKQEFIYYVCNKCKAVFLTGVKPDTNYFKHYYCSDYRDEKTSNILASYIISFSNKVKTNLVTTYSNRKGTISILDIGSGHGHFLKSLPQTKFERWGLEIDRKLLKNYKKEGIKSISENFLTYNFGKKKFDCITMWHVIEHIHDPKKLIKKVYSLLKPDGLFIFSTPNTDSIGFKEGKENWFHLDAPRHFVLYSHSTLSCLANRKFIIVKKRNNWHDFPLDLFWSVKNSQKKYIYYALYPYFKYRDEETITHVWRKIK